MFRLKQRVASSALPASSRSIGRRVALLGAGLALLWLALQLAPKPAPREAAPISTEAVTQDDGVVMHAPPARPGLFSAGTLVAMLLLVGGGGLALFLRRRSVDGKTGAVLLQPLGAMSLAPNQQLRLIRCGDDVLLLGVTTGQINLLKSYSSALFDPSEAASPPAPPHPSAPVSSPEDGRRPMPWNTEQDSFEALLQHQVGGAPNSRPQRMPYRVPSSSEM